MKNLSFVLLATALVAVVSACGGQSDSASTDAASAPIPVKAVVVTMFEIGEDTGDQAAEFQLWYERRNLDQVFEFAGHHDLHFDSENGVLVMVTGIGTAKSTASVMMLGMDPRFDLRQAYWLVAGIAGVDPEDASIGSAAWAEYLVDGDLSHEIDPREMPEDWKYGYIARYTDEPFDEDKPEPTGEMFQTNGELTEWAYQMTKDIELPDFESLDETRLLYTEHPNAQRPPFVLKGDHLAAMTFWHGKILNDWANDWVSYWSEGKGNFVTSAMEDTGTMQALTWLTRAGRADRDRLMVLRTASNYTMPPPGVDAATNLLAENEGYAGLDASLESAYIVGSKVIDTLVANWDEYRDRTPTPDDLSED
ncbi:MAG: NUP-family purine nucleoside permease [Congregibacter sp.]